MDDRTKSNKGDGSASVWCLVLMMTIDRSPSPPAKKEEGRGANDCTHRAEGGERRGSYAEISAGGQKYPVIGLIPHPAANGKVGGKVAFFIA